MKWLFSAARSVAGFVVPGAGPALKWGPWLVAAGLLGLLLIERARLGVADAQTALEAGRVMLAEKTCQADAATANAALNAGALAQMQQQHAAAQAVETQVFSVEAGAQSAAQASSQTLGIALGTISVQAAQPGQDGPVPPVLEGMFP